MIERKGTLHNTLETPSTSRVDKVVSPLVEIKAEEANVENECGIAMQDISSDTDTDTDLDIPLALLKENTPAHKITEEFQGFMAQVKKEEKQKKKKRKIVALQKEERE